MMPFMHIFSNITKGTQDQRVECFYQGKFFITSSYKIVDPNSASESRPSFNFKISTKLQHQNINWTSTSRSLPSLVLKVLMTSKSSWHPSQPESHHSSLNKVSYKARQNDRTQVRSKLNRGYGIQCCLLKYGFLSCHNFLIEKVLIS